MILVCSALVSTPKQIANGFTHFGLHFDSGWTLVDEDKIEIGANTWVHLSGNNPRNRDCSINEFNDFVLPYSDIYIIQVPKGEEEYSKFLADLETEFERPLVDAGGDKNTVVDFLLDSEIIAFTAPDGKLPGPGPYAAIIDTCQDGKYKPKEDYISADTFTVQTLSKEQLAELPRSQIKEIKAKYGELATTVGKIYTKQEIDNQKASPSFEREYNLKYLG